MQIHIYVAGAFRNAELFWIRNSLQEVGKNCRYISVCNSEATSPIALKDGHFVHRGVFLLPTLEPLKKSFVWQSYGRKFTHDRVQRAKMSIWISFNSSTAYFGNTYGACKLYNCLAGTSKAVIHTDTVMYLQRTSNSSRRHCWKKTTWALHKRWL